ncbi:hypothetical protein A0H76_1454 [Hepatospora eriocheir]|uniref:Uncharacterized protein n=1 Tax=Hepatospora eriocheir TaxID=1081669 RepID=A0A1X0QH34_9MICR|nr:hypothetical protein A0H76_1454 [Hepatospora eriocheir]
MKTAYLDFSENFNDIPTRIRIFETEDKTYIFVSQYPKDMGLYNNFLKKLIEPQIKKDLFCICNLKNYDSITKISEAIVKILTNK